MKFNILNRWSGDVQFSAEINCAEDAPPSVKMGLSVKWVYESGADLSGAVLSGAVLRRAVLRRADLSGADLSDADLSDAVLSDADLSGAVLRGAVLSGADLSGADLRGADLSGADLSGAVLSGAVLRRAVLRRAVLSDAVLSGADLSGADLSGAAKIENIHQTIYAAASAPGALDMSVWHNGCGTAHCRAGWVVALAGEAGKELEAKVGTPSAAMLIYLASDPKIDRLPNFYTDNKSALADMKRLAKAEADLKLASAS